LVCPLLWASTIRLSGTPCKAVEPIILSKGSPLSFAVGFPECVSTRQSLSYLSISSFSDKMLNRFPLGSRHWTLSLPPWWGGAVRKRQSSSAPFRDTSKKIKVLTTGTILEGSLHIKDEGRIKHPSAVAIGPASLDWASRLLLWPRRFGRCD